MSDDYINSGGFATGISFWYIIRRFHSLAIRVNILLPYSIEILQYII